MIESVFGFVVGIMATYWALGAALVFLIFVDSSDVDDSIFWPILFGCLVAVSGYLMFHPPWDTLKWVLLGYVPAGLVWSAFKYRKFCTRQRKYVLDGNGGWNEVSKDKTKFTRSQLERYNNRTSMSILTGRVTYWIIFWPLSILVWLIRDFVVDAADYLINNVFKRMYDAIRNSAIKDIEIIEDEPKTEEDRDYSN